MKKLLSILLLLVIAAFVISGCASKTYIPKQTATPNPSLSNTEGGFLPGKQQGVEGTITSLTDKEMVVKAGDEKIKLIISERGEKELKAFNKDPENPMVMKGSYVCVYYEEIKGKKHIRTIEVVQSN